MQPKHVIIRGGALAIKHVNKLLQLSYDKKMEDYDKFKLDKSLSGRRVKVYTDDDGRAYVVHRGTQGFRDVITDLKLPFSKNNNRFKHAEKIQKMAQQKYGTDKTSTLGHSLGADIAHHVGKDSKELLTLNRAVFDKVTKSKPSNHTDIRTKLDPVSALTYFEKKNGKEITIPSTTWSPLAEHTVGVLDRLDPEMIVGEGIKTSSNWIDHVKATQRKNKCSYKNALKLA